MQRNAIIFGTGSLAEVIHFYLENDSNYKVVGFTVSDDHFDTAGSDSFRDLPLVAFSDVVDRFSPAECDMFIAVGYVKLNQLREKFAAEAQAKGYRLLSYVSSRATTWGDTVIGENVFIFEDNTIQPFVTIGDGTILWSGNHIGHHSNIGPFCFITSHVVVSGHCQVGARCFVGVNSTISEDTIIADDNIIGPCSLIQKNTKPSEVYIAERTKKFPKPSSSFFR
ncbi:acetyltransferase [Thalassospira sp. SM2505]